MFKEDCFQPTVSLDSFHLGFLLVQIHGLKCAAANIGNSYLTVFTGKKLYIVAGKEFGPEYEGKRLLVYKCVYGTHTGGDCFNEMLSIKLCTHFSQPRSLDAEAEGGWVQIHYLLC